MHYKTILLYYNKSYVKEIEMGLTQAHGAQKSIYVFKGLMLKGCHASI